MVGLLEKSNYELQAHIYDECSYFMPVPVITHLDTKNPKVWMHSVLPFESPKEANILILNIARDDQDTYHSDITYYINNLFGTCFSDPGTPSMFTQFLREPMKQKGFKQFGAITMLKGTVS